MNAVRPSRGKGIIKKAAAVGLFGLISGTLSADEPAAAGQADARSSWSIGAHFGRAVKQSINTGEVFMPSTWESEGYSLASLGVRKLTARPWAHSRIFTELNVSRISGKETYGEIFLTPTITWDSFPWDHRWDTTLGLGAGLSYTTTAAEVDDTGQRWMASMIVELEVQPAVWLDWSAFTRLHHRSSAFGTFSDESGFQGSNFPSLGVRYHF